jgi:hypothetical protein
MHLISLLNKIIRSLIFHRDIKALFQKCLFKKREKHEKCFKILPSFQWYLNCILIEEIEKYGEKILTE